MLNSIHKVSTLSHSAAHSSPSTAFYFYDHRTLADTKRLRPFTHSCNFNTQGLKQEGCLSVRLACPLRRAWDVCLSSIGGRVSLCSFGSWTHHITSLASNLEIHLPLPLKHSLHVNSKEAWTREDPTSKRKSKCWPFKRNLIPTSEGEYLWSFACFFVPSFLSALN